MGAPDPPFVCVLADCNVRYEGRARATQGGGRLAVVVKDDGAVVAHALDGQVSPQFYNPGGDTRAWTRLDRLYIRAESSKGELLKINGVPEGLHDVRETDGLGRAPRRYVEGLEHDLASWLAENPGVLGLADMEPEREAARTGGRVDLFYPDGTAVEVKRRATVRAYDQARRYLRDPEIERVVIACLRSSDNLVASCRGASTIRVVELSPGTLPRELRKALASK